MDKELTVKLKKLHVCLLALTLVLGLQATAWGSYVTLEVGGGYSQDIPFTLNEELGIYELNYSYSDPGGAWLIGLNATLQTDPSLTYSLNAQNRTTSPENFSFTFHTLMTLPAGSTVVNASIVGGLTDSTGNGVSIYPVSPATKLQSAKVSSPLTSLGVDVGDGVSHGSTGGIKRTYTYGSYDAGPQAGPYSNGAWTQLSTITAFTLSGYNDATALTGFAEIEVVPVPSSLLLLGGGLLGLVCLGRRKKG